MEKTIKIENFTEIRKLEFYKGSELLAKTLIKAGSSAISDPDFIETDFKYFQDKLEFSNPDILSLLTDRDKEEIGGDLGSVEKYLLTLFPTITKEDVSGKTISFFSTYIDSKGNEILVVIVPEFVTKVKMYENSDDTEEAILIRFVGDEILFSKVLWLITSYEKPVYNKDGIQENRAINLSWTAYKGDKNPVKRMSDYVLRNDSFVHDFSGLQEDEEGFIYSAISGSLVGTVKQSDRPIYNLLKGFSRTEWNKRVRYSLGDTVSLGGKTYESVEPNNIGNHPYYSRLWFKR